jgi:hypothetical protein
VEEADWYLQTNIKENRPIVARKFGHPKAMLYQHGHLN